MKKKYIIPQMTMVTFAGETFCEGFNGASGLNNSDQNHYGGSGAKENNFSSWDYGFDEEDESESNSSSKSLWD
ncbi:hypothetical protein [Segatella hominis]|jgi:hypothetical protein|uniref:hypothetical protein n=1 Tax=Segatella hominis TaxID=2518605 RepID=UPI003AB952E2